MSTENKDIPAEELKRMEDNAHNSVMVSSLLEMPFDLYMRGAKAEYLRHLSGKAAIEIEIRRSTIDRLYQSIMASGHPFPGELRDIFHKAMNALGASPSSKPEIGPRWVKASEQLPLHKAHWITGKYGTHDNDFPVRMEGRYCMANIYDERLAEELSPKYMLRFDGRDHYEDEFSEIEWLLDESIPSSEPLPATEETKLNVEQIVQFTEEVGYFYEIVGGGKGKNLIWENIELGSRSTTAELLVCFLEGVGLRLSTIDMAEPAKESQPDAFLEWLHEEIEFCEPRVKGEEIQNGTSGNYWMGQINLLRQVREKYLSPHARPKPEPSEEKKPDDIPEDFFKQALTCMMLGGYGDRFMHGAIWAHRHYAPSSPPSVKPDEMRSLTYKESEVLDKTLYRTAKKERSVKPEREDNWISIKESPEEYRQVLLWFEGLKTIAIGYLINGSWADENKNLLWCEPDHWAAMPTPPSHPSSAPPAVQQEDGEMPGEMKAWIMDWSRDQYQVVYDDDAHAMAVEADRHIARGAMKAMYHKMQEEITDVRDCLKSEIMGYKTVITDQNEQLCALRQEKEDYRKAILYAQEIKDLWSADSYGEQEGNWENEGEMQALAAMKDKFSELILKYTPQTPTK